VVLLLLSSLHNLARIIAGATFEWLLIFSHYHGGGGTYLDHILIFHPLLETFQTCKWLMNKPLIEFSSGLSELCFCEIRYRLWIFEALQYNVSIVGIEILLPY